MSPTRSMEPALPGKRHDPARVVSTRAFWEAALPALAVALTSTMALTGFIPGLHGDEAQVLLRIFAIAHGARPLSGMTNYTAPLNEYLAWPFVAAAGYRIWALRMVCGITNAIACLFALAIVRRLHPGDRAILRWTAALWVTSVPFVLFSRDGIELTMLTPALVMGGLWLVAVAVHAKSQVRVHAAGLGSGFVFGLAVYNHVLALAIVAALAFGAFSVLGRALFRQALFQLIAAGFCGGMLLATANIAGLLADRPPPATVHAGSAPASGNMGTATANGDAAVSAGLARMVSKSWVTILDFGWIPRVLSGILDGQLMFQRYTGERLIPVVPYFTLALLGLGAMGWWRRRKRPMAPIDRALLVAWLAMPIAIRLIAPDMSLRFFELPALVAPYALVRFASSGTSQVEGPSRLRRIASATLGLVLVLQVGYVGTDYFWAFARSGGRLSYFQLGTYLAETSNHFVRTNRLYSQLVHAGVREVVGEPLLVWSLAGYEIPAHRLEAVNFDAASLMEELTSPRIPGGKVAIVLYNIPAPAGGEALNQLRDLKRLDAGSFHYFRDPEFDGKFAVLVSDRVVEAKDPAKIP